MNRRTFLRSALPALAGCAWLLESGRLSRTLWASNRSLVRIGLQLYTVRSLLQDDFEGTLRNVASVGFHEVEFAGYYQRSPGQIRSLLSDLGLQAPAAHVSLNMVRENLDELIESARTIGHHYLIVPSLPQQERGSLDFYKEVAQLFNRVGERCRQAGLKFGYHNHAFEFEPIDGQLPYDVLLDSTDPQLVDMELDIFWIKRGGYDPLDYFERYPGRFALCHVKDMDESGTMVDVGQGAIDFRAIFARSEQAGLKYYIVEHDRPETPLASISNSFNYLSELRF